MATVAIIHAAEDTLPARALAEKLREARLTVVVEKAGEELRNVVRDAQVSIALWSPRSVQAPVAIEDAKFARGAGKIIHVTMQNASMPSGFGGDKPVNLTGWRGEDDFAAWRDLAKMVTDKAGVPPLPPPAPRPASGFFQPGVVRNPSGGGSAAAPTAAPRPQQQQRSQPARPQQGAARPQPMPRAQPANMADPVQPGAGGGGRGMLIGIIAFVVVAIGGGAGYYFWNQSQNAASTTAWDAVAQNDPDAIRAFLAGDPGDYRDEAQAALASLEERTYEAASDADTIDAFENFLNDFPESQHALAARGRIAELRSMPPETSQDETTGVLPPDVTPVDPDLLPPTADTTPDTGDGPPSLTPPADDNSAAEPGAPTN